MSIFPKREVGLMMSCEIGSAKVSAEDGERRRRGRRNTFMLQKAKGSGIDKGVRKNLAEPKVCRQVLGVCCQKK
jgi:hypothetical protein